MIDTLRVWTEVDSQALDLPLPLPWHPQVNRNTRAMRAVWSLGTTGVNLSVRFLRKEEGRLHVSAECSLPRLIHGRNQPQLSPDEIGRAVGLLLARVHEALPKLAHLGPEEWRVGMLDLSEDLVLPEGLKARDAMRRIAEAMRMRPEARWLLTESRNGLMLRHPARKAGEAGGERGESHSDGPTLKVYDKGAQGRARGSQKLRIELRLSGQAAKVELGTYRTLDRLVEYLHQSGLARLKKDWESAFSHNIRRLIDAPTVEAIRIAKFPTRSAESKRRENQKLREAKVRALASLSFQRVEDAQPLQSDGSGTAARD